MCNRLDTIPACVRQTDRHLAMAYSPCYAYASRGKNWLIAIMYESRLSRHIQSYFMCNIILLCEYHFPISKQTAEFYIAVTLSILTTHLDVIRGR